MMLTIRFPQTGRFILASNSPRRREILKLVIPSFEIHPADISETALPGESPEQMAERLAIGKCRSIYEQEEPAAVVGADTVVAMGRRMFGKPGTRTEAVDMLMSLSGKTHEVHTGVALCTVDGCASFCETTRVTFHPVDRQLIEWYADTKEPMDKAGAYGIQGKGALLIDSIRGDYLNVVGFPLSTFMRVLWDKGYVSFHE